MFGWVASILRRQARRAEEPTRVHHQNYIPGFWEYPEQKPSTPAQPVQPKKRKKRYF